MNKKESHFILTKGKNHQDNIALLFNFFLFIENRFFILLSIYASNTDAPNFIEGILDLKLEINSHTVIEGVFSTLRFI